MSVSVMLRYFMHLRQTLSLSLFQKVSVYEATMKNCHTFQSINISSFISVIISIVQKKASVISDG